LFLNPISQRYSPAKQAADKARQDAEKAAARAGIPSSDTVSLSQTGRTSTFSTDSVKEILSRKHKPVVGRPRGIMNGGALKKVHMSKAKALEAEAERQYKEQRGEIPENPETVFILVLFRAENRTIYPSNPY